MIVCAIALMAKAPLPGAAKTRLAPALGEAGAAALAQRLLSHALEQALAAGIGPVTLWTAPDTSHPAFVRAQRQGATLAVQGPGDLGERMAQVFVSHFAHADAPLLLMGTDAPALDAAMLQRAAAALAGVDAVFVPAHDGGYALVGLRVASPPLLAALFAGMTWSTSRVMADTRQRLAEGGFSHTELPAVHDIDEPADLAQLPPQLRVAAGAPAGRHPRREVAAAVLAGAGPGAGRDRIAGGAGNDDDNRPLHRPSTDFATMPETTPNPEPHSLPPGTAPDAPEVAGAAPAPATEPAAEPAPEPAVEPAGAAAPDAPVAEPRPVPIPDLSPAACAAALAEHFPALFGAGRMLPIKLRIQADIQQRVPGLFSKKSLSIFLHRHTTSTAYIKALVNSPHRFDLDGQPAGDIAQEHRDAGVVELERRLAIVQARRVAEREAQRQARRPQVAVPVAVPAAGVDGAPAAEGVPADQRPARPPRPPRPPRPDRPQHADRPPRREGAPPGDRPPHPDRQDRPPRADRPPRQDRAPDAQRAPFGPADTGAPVHAAPEAAAPPAPSVPLSPEQIAENEARRGRAALLRAFETTTLTRSNFCALKGLKEDVLEAQLVQAREERKLHPPPAADRDRDRDRDRPREDRPRFEDRGRRRDAPPRPGGPRGGRPPR